MGSSANAVKSPNEKEKEKSLQDKNKTEKFGQKMDSHKKTKKGPSF